MDAEKPGTGSRVCSAARMPICQAAGGDPNDAAAFIAELNVALTVGLPRGRPPDPRAGPSSHFVGPLL